MRWQWNIDAGPVTENADAFVAAFCDWMNSHTDSHVAFVAQDNDTGDAVGMAWLACLARPPDPGELDRRVGDLQSVYVVPNLRNLGVGSALISAVVDHARGIGMERLTVTAGSRSGPLYLRHGFTAAERLLQLTL